jgi:hypothetical protein
MHHFLQLSVATGTNMFPVRLWISSMYIGEFCALRTNHVKKLMKSTNKEKGKRGRKKPKHSISIRCRIFFWEGGGVSKTENYTWISFAWWLTYLDFDLWLTTRLSMYLKLSSKQRRPPSKKNKRGKNLSPRNRQACHNISTALLQRVSEIGT